MSKGIIAFVLIISVSSLSLIPYNSAQAIFGAADTVIEVGPLTTVISPGNWIVDTFSWLLSEFIHYVFDILLEEFKLRVLNTMVNQIVAWVTGADTGDPQFIQNWEAYSAGAYNTGFYSVGGELNVANVCRQFKNQVINSAWRGVSLPVDENSLFIARMGCTLNSTLESLGSSPEAYHEDFRNGGWAAYSEQLFRPQNTYYGALFTSLDEANNRGFSKQNSAQYQGLASQGYKPIKRCAFPAGAPPEQCLRFQVTSPASVFESALNASVKSRFDYIVNADQFVSIVAIVIDGFVNKLIGAGIDGLLGYGSESGNAGSGYIDPGTACEDINSEACALERESRGHPIGQLPDGSACFKNSDCASLFCSQEPGKTSGTCEVPERGAEGGRCFANNTCNTGLECNLQNDTCVAIFGG